MAHAEQSVQKQPKEKNMLGERGTFYFIYFGQKTYKGSSTKELYGL